MRTATGFDYRLGHELTLTTREWRDRLAQVLGDGGIRRVEHGETFAHTPVRKHEGLPPEQELAFEVYANIPAPKGRGA